VLKVIGGEQIQGQSIPFVAQGVQGGLVLGILHGVGIQHRHDALRPESLGNAVYKRLRRQMNQHLVRLGAGLHAGGQALNDREGGLKRIGKFRVGVLLAAAVIMEVSPGIERSIQNRLPCNKEDLVMI